MNRLRTILPDWRLRAVLRDLVWAYRPQTIAVLLASGLILAGAFSIVGPRKEQEASAAVMCDPQLELVRVAEQIRRLATAKEMCGYLRDWQIYRMCTGIPSPKGALGNDDTCPSVKETANELLYWIDRMLPPALEACQRQAGECEAYLSRRVVR